MLYKDGRIKQQILLPLYLAIYLCYCHVSLCQSDGYAIYHHNSNEHNDGWAIKLEGSNTLERAKRLAEKYGFLTAESIGDLDGYYHLEHPQRKRLKRGSENAPGTLVNDDEVIWAERQHTLKRAKRGVHHQKVVTRGIQPRFADPLWDEQWYLDDKRNLMDLDVNVIPVWNNGVSGKGVVVTILDDGIEHNHTDLVQNYDAAASWDINDNDPDPFPRYDPTNENKHGTRCAGEVAAQANNSKCGVGVAYNARIGGVRMLDGRVTDRVEAESLSLNPQYIDIYSASWGPSDDGMTVEGPGTLASAAFLNGISKGRSGLGSIYVWASGNGGRHDDSCNCDGYTASIYTLSISSSSDHGESPWYSEACSSTLATTLSSGAHGEKRIVTTDLHNQCTERHTGTSASAPLAAGIVALALEKNKKLTWRDIQHIVVFSANWVPLKRDPDWRMNGIGLHVNEKFGFGLLDAERIVQMATSFKPVPDKNECKGSVFSTAKSIRWDQPLMVDIESNGCQHTHNEIRYLEHVQVVLTIEYPRRGDLTIFITTPMGTRSCLLPVRSEDSSDEGFRKWAFMTTHAWGEDPRGKWFLEIRDGGDSRSNQGVLRDWQLVMHGTKEKPKHQNVTHSDVPIHRKAVADDMVTKNPQSSVQITQITYTFGQPALMNLPQLSMNPLPMVIQQTPQQIAQQKQQKQQQALQKEQHAQQQAQQIHSVINLNKPSIFLQNLMALNSAAHQQQQQQQQQQHVNTFAVPSASIQRPNSSPSVTERQQGVNENGQTGMLGAEYMPNMRTYNPYQSNLAQTRSFLGQTPNYGNLYQQYQKKQQQARFLQQSQQQKPSPSQINLSNNLVGRSISQWPTSSFESQTPVQVREQAPVYSEAQVSHLWDIFGRLNGKRESNEQEEMMIEAEAAGTTLLHPDVVEFHADETEMEMRPAELTNIEEHNSLLEAVRRIQGLRKR